MDQTNVTVAMTVANWNMVMKALGELPFKDVADIIMIIKAQAEAQLAPKPAEEPAQAEVGRAEGFSESCGEEGWQAVSEPC